MQSRELERDSAGDPLASLHKMSVTAGVANQQYRAINAMSVLAGLLGAASLLAIVWHELLFIPVAALICGFIAWRQINGSNGTQTGKPLVIAGLLLSLALGGGVGIIVYRDAAQTRADEADIARLVDRLGQAIHNGDYDAAYALFSDNFHQRYSQIMFARNLMLAQSPRHFGPLQSMTWNHAAPQYEMIDADTVQAPVTKVVVIFQLGQDEFPVRFRRTATGLVIEDFSFFFPASRQPIPPPAPPVEV